MEWDDLFAEENAPAKKPIPAPVAKPAAVAKPQRSIEDAIGELLSDETPPDLPR